MLDRVTPKRLVLRILLAAIVVSSIVGIVGILDDGFGKIGVHTLLTAVLVAAAAMLELAALTVWDQASAKISSRLAAYLTPVALVYWIGLVWVEPHRDSYWQAGGSFALISIAAAHAAMLWAARLPPRFTWLRTVALAGNVMIAALLLAALWEHLKSSSGGQIVAILCVAETGLTIAIGALAAASRSTPTAGDIAEVCFCPRCGKSLWVAAGEVRCRHCLESFFIELRKVEDLPDAVLRN